mmetsp:Transcript_22571/g.52391  ORF Transcript_22571/g.52391 Transcript_22571/m.52391 type:complete len:273 (-) Transcript_22571:99-917(-)
MESVPLQSSERRSRITRVAVMVACAMAVLGVAAYVTRSAEQTQGSQELFWGGPLSFDMVHTHILNMKMRRSRLKEKLKEAALARKDQELAQEHGFKQGKGGQLTQTAPAAPQQQLQQQPPPQPQQMQMQPQQQYAPQQAYGAPPQQYSPQQAYGAPPQQYQAPMQPQQAYQYPPQQQAAPQYQQQYPQYMQPPQEAPQLAQQPMYAPQQPQQASPWGGPQFNAAQGAAVPHSGPTESSNDDKDQQRSQAAASIQAYEAFMHGGGAAPAKAAK